MTLGFERAAVALLLAAVALGRAAPADAQTVVRLDTRDSVAVTMLQEPGADMCLHDRCAIAIEPLTGAVDSLVAQRTIIALWKQWRARLDSDTVRVVSIATIITGRGASSPSVDQGDRDFALVRGDDGGWMLYGKSYSDMALRLLVPRLRDCGERGRGSCH